MSPLLIGLCVGFLILGFALGWLAKFLRREWMLYRLERKFEKALEGAAWESAVKDKARALRRQRKGE